MIKSSIDEGDNRGYIFADMYLDIQREPFNTKPNLRPNQDLNKRDIMVAYDDNAIITCIKINKQLGRIFMGTANGEVRCHFWFDVPMKQFIYNYTRILLFNCGVHSIDVCNGNR